MRVSVICPVYNTSPALLREAARSVLDEPSGAVAELLFADDHSDNSSTISALAELATQDTRVRILRANRNGGPAAARNLALAAATGDWIGFLDADDLWTSDHLTQAQAVLDAYPASAWIAANHDTLDRDGVRTPSALLSAAHAGTTMAPGLICHTGRQATRALIGNYWLHLGGSLVRTDMARAAGGFAESCLYSEDWLFFLCVSTLTDLYYLEAATYVLRRQHASFTTSNRRLSIRRADGKRAAMAHPMLRPFRRELRWALHSTWKGLAANNLLAGHRLRGLGFAVRAFKMDPRTVGELVEFVRLATIRDTTRLRLALSGYSQAELSISRGAQ